MTLPLPPSTNNLYHNHGNRRRRTGKYVAWHRNAILSIFAQVRADFGVRGPVALTIAVPDGMRGDIDNRLKATIDALVASRRIDDDKHVSSITIQRGGAEAGTILVKATGAL